MAGWELSKGYIVRRDLSMDEMWSVMNAFFSGRFNFTTTYKFAFFKCILDNLFNIDDIKRLDFDFIFTRFTEIYWNLVVKNGLCQIQQNSQFSHSAVEKIILATKEGLSIDSSVPFESLKKDIQNQLIREVSRECKKYVIGAFYKDTDCVVYAFNKKDSKLLFNECFRDFFIKYKCVLEKSNYLEWIKFLEKVNPREKTFALALKLDYATKRENLGLYRAHIQTTLGMENCFYCNQKLSDKIEVDHFIPWSFIKDDKIWNLVLSCRKCNNAKRDSLAHSAFLPIIVQRNQQIIEDKKLGQFESEFAGYTPQKIESIYQSAVFNGLKTGWGSTLVNQ